MQNANHTDVLIENADRFELFRNPTYVQMQRTLIERTAERDKLRCVYQSSLLLYRNSDALPLLLKGRISGTRPGCWAQCV